MSKYVETIAEALIDVLNGAAGMSVVRFSFQSVHRRHGVGGVFA
jgi:hypothetical protein